MEKDHMDGKSFPDVQNPSVDDMIMYYLWPIWKDLILTFLNCDRSDLRVYRKWEGDAGTAHLVLSS